MPILAVIALWQAYPNVAIGLTIGYVLMTIIFGPKAYSRYREIKKLCLTLSVNLRLQFFVSEFIVLQQMMSETITNTKEVQGTLNPSEERYTTYGDIMDTFTDIMPDLKKWSDKLKSYEDIKFSQVMEICDQYNAYKKEDLIWHYRPSKEVKNAIAKLSKNQQQP